MKKTIKFSFAALALATLASCSGDDLLGKGNNPLQQNDKNKLIVEVEDLVDPLTTRAVVDEAGKPHWQVGDYIRVYDDALTKYDEYSFTGEGFETTEEYNIIKTPSYALFAPVVGAEITDYGWIHKTQTSEVVYTINADWAWSEDKETLGDGNVAYLSNLPMWGIASKTAEGDVSADLKWLTSVVRVSLKNIPNNIRSFTLTAYKDLERLQPAQLSGEFKAVIETRGEVDVDAALKATAEDATGMNSITVNFYNEDETYNASIGDAYLYLPIMAGTYGTLVASYVDGNGTNHPDVWIGKEVAFVKGQFRRLNLNDLQFDEAGLDIPAVNAALKAAEDVTDEVVIKTANVTTLTNDEATIIIPAGMQSKNITLDLQGFDGTGLTNKTLYVKSEDGSDYEGQLIIQVPAEQKEDGTYDHTAANSKVKNVTYVHVNMPKANVVFAGNWGATNIGQNNKTESLKVNQLTIAKGATVGSIYPNASCCQANTEGADILIAEDGQATGVTLTQDAKIDAIEVNGKVSGTLAVAVKDSNDNDLVVNVTMGKGSYIGTMNTNQAEVTVPANATINSTLNAYKATKITVQGIKLATLNSYNGATISITGTAATVNAHNGGTVSVTGSITGTLTGDNSNWTDAPEDAKQVATLTISGNGSVKDAKVPGANVVIRRSTTGAAVTGTLTMGENKKLTLSGGYIKTLAEAKNLIFVNTETSGVATGINAVTNVELAEAEYTSVWGGAKHTTLTDNNGSKEIWTASQFAAYDGKTGVTLNGNIDLNDLAFTPAANVTAIVDGNYKTVSKISITSAKAAGLFLSMSNTGSIKNLLINGIGINQTAAGTATAPVAVGALVATASGGTISGVNVKYAVLNSASWAVGGLVGNVTGALEIKGAKDANTLGDANKYSTVAATITGKNKLGGLVGQMSANVTISGYKTVVDFAEATEELAANQSNRTNFGTVAPFVGTATAGELSVTIPSGGATAELTYAKRLELNFQHNRAADSNVNLCYFVGHTQIGYVPTTATGFKLNNITNLTPVTVATKALATTSNNSNVNVFLLDTAYTAEEEN